MRCRALVFFLFMSACAGPLPVWTETSASMPVSVLVLPVASVNVTPLVFGPFTRGVTTVPGMAVITVTLSSGIPYFVTINAGMHFADSWRNVEGSGFLARYALFQASGAEWGDADFAGSYPRGRSAGGIGTGASQSYNVRGELYVSSLAANAPAGSYQDVLLVTVYY